MKKALITLAILLLSIPAGAATGTIERTDTGSPILNRDQQVEEQVPGNVRYVARGTFLVTQVPDEPEHSIEIPQDAIRYQVFEDGSVTFQYAKPEQELPSYDPEPILDVAEEDVDEETWQAISAGVYPV